jgi:hypothetical protein
MELPAIYPRAPRPPRLLAILIATATTRKQPSEMRSRQRKQLPCKVFFSHGQLYVSQLPAGQFHPSMALMEARRTASRTSYHRRSDEFLGVENGSNQSLLVKSMRVHRLDGAGYQANCFPLKKICFQSFSLKTK